ncbi:alpha/beta hydrolase fold [Duganella sp. CF402]|uniref:alpha/beta fold hydrolase n=1 Tax=unclassified Duganella TaxID=2636909 RepID=UPI0008C27A61|nr:MULTISPECIES: alpha/beta fold hydrolase [unclassified Duganella]RZT08488.1 alpha/beta hydrolase family protein [Duganella sp. BK701]SEL92074.1 alpha/beta hydrolase fold [Duganella sp. CF402]
MTNTIHHRRRFLRGAAIAAAIVGAPLIASAEPLLPLPVQQVQTDTLDIGYHEAGPADGHPIILLHGASGDILRYAEVAPVLARQGYRVLVPYLRGHGSTRLLDAVSDAGTDASAPRAYQQAVLGQDLLDFMDALHIPEAVLAGFDLGGRAAAAVAARKPTRVVGLVLADGMSISGLADAVAASARNGKWRT